MKRTVNNAWVYSTVETDYMWAIRSDCGKFYEQLTTDHGYTGLQFTDRIQSAAIWDTRQSVRDWIKQCVYCRYHALKPVKVQVQKTYTVKVV
jgi:hypothetical protein